MGKGQVGGRAGIPTQLSPVSDPEHLLSTVYPKVTLSSKYTVLLLFIL